MGVLDGRVALVTGGSRGIGRAITLAFAHAGADVAINYFGPAERGHPEAAAQAASEVEALHRSALVVEADVGREDAVRAMVDRVHDKFGRVDILVNNAGFVTTCIARHAGAPQRPDHQHRYADRPDRSHTRQGLSILASCRSYYTGQTYYTGLTLGPNGGDVML